MNDSQKLRWEYLENGMFGLFRDSLAVLQAHAQAFSADGRKIDTRYARLEGKELTAEGTLLLTFRDKDGLVLREYLRNDSDFEPIAWCELSDAKAETVESRQLMPLIIQAPREDAQDIWKSLWTKMLLVPYDNTMWLRYEAAPLRSGRKSYDLTVLFDEESREGLLLGALDFDTWKNAVVCSGTDARTLNAVCGVADEGTHDSQIHGSLIGKVVSSSQFCVIYGSDYRRLLERYGDLVASRQSILAWEEGVPFGFNSWAGLAFRLNADSYRASGRFLREELRNVGYANSGVNYCNLDAGWNQIPEETLVALVKELHENSQKAGIYDAPFAFFGQDDTRQIEGMPGHTYSEILLRDADGRSLPRVDGAIPYDVTHPLWKQFTARKLECFVRWGFDYVKLDFMSHGGMEGCYWDKAVRTGRQAIRLGYEWINAQLSRQKTGHPIFISLSIAPLFPCGYGHARRFSCDAFGTKEDVEYVLNAQTWAWWENGRLYQYNDPDHICLLRSFGMEKDSDLGEARARYTASVIAGTVMMLSDDYERSEARKRTLNLAGNREINEIAASGVSFCPVESNNASASSVFTARINGKQYVAIFHWREKEDVIRVDCARADLRRGTTYQELWSGRMWMEQDGALSWHVSGCDAIVLREN